MVTGGGSPAGTWKGSRQEEAQRHAQQPPPLLSAAVATSWIRDIGPNDSNLFLLLLQLLVSQFYSY